MSDFPTLHSSAQPTAAANSPTLSGPELLRSLLDSWVIHGEDFTALSAEVRQQLMEQTDREQQLAILERHQLLTSFQVGRVRKGLLGKLVLGNYRLLRHLGSGGMGQVYEAEHVWLRQPVAVKVLALPPTHDEPMLARFLTEMRAVAQLDHPNIVAAKDAGKLVPEDPDAAVLHYFVMEFVAGQDLEELVHDHGPLPVAKACDVIYQIACALAEAHKHQLVHRDVKPSNILLTPEGQAKLLDFGLARRAFQRLTEPGAILGTVDYMAPEQARDSSSVDGRADIYGLGGTLYWCLTGQPPFPHSGNRLEGLLARLRQEPPSLRRARPELPPALDELVARMMANQPEDRYPSTAALLRGLLPFLDQSRPASVLLPASPVRHAAEVPGRSAAILLVDDEADIRAMARFLLEAEGFTCHEAGNGQEALDALARQRYDLVLLDVDMPRRTGLEVLRQLRAEPPGPHLKIIMVSGRASGDEMAQMMLAGADDYLTKPFSTTQLKARIRTALDLKEAQDRTDQLTQQLMTINADLERDLLARDSDLVQVRNALVLALAKLVECRTTETAAHLLRMQRYCRCLAEAAAVRPAFQGQLDAAFINMLECCAPLHDLGKVGLPDHILLKPGKYEPDERVIMQSHTTIGADTLQKVARRHGAAVAFLPMAIDVARHHHERFDGAGYPDRLAGERIPLAARILAVGDVYDALRTRQTYRPAMTHRAAVELMTAGSPGHFDPQLLETFHALQDRFERIYQDLPNGSDF